MGRKVIYGFLVVLAVLFSLGKPALVVAQPSVAQVRVAPTWAPYYENVNQVRYYYLPDIQCYYDVWNHQFIYLQDGRWRFSSSLPSRYASYKLNNSYAVVLNYQVQQPWHRYRYYVVQYPRYYYRTIYRDTYNDRDRPIRGYNENIKTVVYNNNHTVNVENHTEVKHPQQNNEQSYQNNTDKKGKEIQQPENKQSNNNNTDKKIIEKQQPSNKKVNENNTSNKGKEIQQPPNKQLNENNRDKKVKEIRTPVRVNRPMMKPVRVNKSIMKPVQMKKG